MIHAGMKVLFIAPKFFGYEQEIKRELELAGCSVDWFDDRPSSTAVVKALIRLKPELISFYSDAYFERTIEASQDIQYDAVFVIKGEALSKELLERLKKSQSNAKFLYYSWDSLKNFKNSTEKLAGFDKIYSFDSDDCVMHPSVRHLPLFYTRAYESLSMNNQALSTDLLFLGSIHSDRYSVTQRIWSAARNINANIRLHDHFFYQSKWVFALRKLYDKQFKAIPWRSVKWNSLNAEQTLALIAQSQVIVDVHHPGQNGLTMRTIESLGARKKLITTNTSVAEYDFFHPDNIVIIDRLSPVIPATFFNSEYQAIAPSIYKKYSLAEWLQEIFT